MSVPVDLRELAVERKPPTAAATRRKTAVVSRYLVPVTLLVGFAAVLGWSLRESLLPATSVTVLPVVASRSESVAAETPLFQAAGWIEPRPQAVMVTALTEGIVDEILVVEGEVVTKGQVIARLIRRDGEIEVQRTAADVRLREAELASAKAEQTAAAALLKEPLSRQEELAAAVAQLTKVETEIARLPTLVRAATAKRDFAAQDVAGKTNAGDAIPAIALARAKSEFESAKSSLDELKQQATSLDREREALAERQKILQRRLELKIDETQRVAEAEAQVAIGEARLQQAQAAHEAAELKLARSDVKAPTSGRVLSLYARPGSRLMGIDRAALVDASTVASIYDPASLQVRADVRLEDVRHVVPGQQVRISSPVSAEQLNGRVLMATSQADMQKNTLQVKVAIDDPPAALKPDMLVQATFLAPQHEGANETSAVRLLVPRQLLQSTGDDATVWVADRTTSTASRRRVTVGAIRSDNMVEITAGLNIGDRLIVSGRESLADGARIRIVEDDPHLGREHQE